MTKVEALEKAIEKLESPDCKYSWNRAEHCNCGILAKTCLEKNDGEFYDLIYRKTDSPFYHTRVLTEDEKRGATWQQSADGAIKCMATGLQISVVFKVLLGIGFTLEEIGQLEHLENKKILAKTGMLVYDRKSDVIRYLRTWIEILKEETPIIEPEKSKTVYKVVRVAESIIEQKMILN